jgi:hypothetical protein
MSVFIIQTHWRRMVGRSGTGTAGAAEPDRQRLNARRLEIAHLHTRIVSLPKDHDPNSYFLAGATAADFRSCLEQAQSL